jgi:hypothetical protein
MRLFTGYLLVLLLCLSLTPAQRSTRARIAANDRWAKEPDRLKATQPGRNAAFQKLLNEVDPEGTLPEDERLKRARNAQKAHLERIGVGCIQSPLAQDQDRRRR